MRNDKVVYVGSSKNVKKRLNQHFTSKVFHFHSFKYVIANGNRMSLEYALIEKHQPEYNKHGTELKSDDGQIVKVIDEKQELKEEVKRTKGILAIAIHSFEIEAKISDTRQEKYNILADKVDIGHQLDRDGDNEVRAKEIESFVEGLKNFCKEEYVELIKFEGGK
jgi:hypothetical protein